MKKPFTNAGFQAEQAELYQLPEAQLQVQAQQVLLGFKTWMFDHFLLSAEQVAFLDMIDQQMISFLAALTSSAIGNRLEIVLIKAEKSSLKDDDKKRKIIRTENNMTAGASSSGEYGASGALLIIIEYLMD